MIGVGERRAGFEVAGGGGSNASLLLYAGSIAWPRADAALGCRQADTRKTAGRQAVGMQAATTRQYRECGLKVFLMGVSIDCTERHRGLCCTGPRIQKP